jgi:hypothetical protein
MSGGITARTSDDRSGNKLNTSEASVRQYAATVAAVAEMYGVRAGSLADSILNLEGQEEQAYHRLLEGTTDDETRCKVVALQACLLAKTHGSTARVDEPIAVTKQVEAIPEAHLRDTLYLHHWCGRSVEEIAEMQSIRVLTVKQNHAWAVKKLGGEVPDNWRSRFADRPSVVASLESLLAGSDSLSPSEQELYTDAMTAAARCLSSKRTFVVGQRTVRVTYGRAWVESPERLPIAEQRLMAAEERASYERTKLFTLTAQPNVFTIRFTRVETESGRPEMSLWWESGRGPTAVLDDEGNFLAECGPDNRSYRFDVATVPFEFSIREMGKI